ncbi:beta-glucosidase [Paenibacillus dendritiformis]|uniref:glycoside hydrolase family 3 protein n=1 Tax=Paenibacillus TaxID=44249 RepID=UPI001B178680|nr:glycoside hydrolase family 3 N-terminal domain-containing protein [Paenibacillus dendritiformis]MEB9894791.1 glycoside hydrolase family 3 N-terminal domain-containing protein [Bacillus cereus]GIO82119.1 beta-glucosidase [Paenibacillus dendritiformis]
MTQKQTTAVRQEETIAYVHNQQGPTLGYSKTSGVSILERDGFYFKDLNRNGSLDKYEDWRLPPEERAKDLASRMSIEQIAGLMLYSRHQAIPAASGGWFASTYAGKTYEESGANPWDLTDEQIKFLTEDHVRHILVTSVESPETAALWSNAVQAFAEGTGLGIPANNSSDPRHSSDSSSEFNAGAGGAISMWPEPLGLAATFDPELVRRFGEIAAKEYRALGIATALSPQIDIATDPRWFRFNGTFGEDSRLAADMGRAYIDGFQTSAGDAEIADGWGYDSVNAMVKHWPGGGSGEGGRDAHYACGKYAVYPGNNFEEHLKPFTEGAFRLDGPTKMASAVMPYYTISTDQDTVNGENVGNSYNAYLIRDLLRGQYGYDGVVCTDWLITADESGCKDSFLSGKPWGVEELSVAERHYKLIMSGVDQFGGNNEIEPVLEAYRMGVAEHGKEAMRKRFEQSAVRLLTNMFRLGLFENPYLDVEASARIAGNPSYMQAGYEAQLKSIVMLKNKNGVLPLKPGSTVYIPQRYTPPGKDWFGNPTPETLEYPLNLEIAAKYFKVTDNPDEADFALVCMRSPKSGTGYSQEDADHGGNGYVPISLQYKPYTAAQARKRSLAGDVREGEAQNRSYYAKTVTTHNAADLDALLDTAERMKGKPVIVSLLLSTPAVVAEFEPAADGILAHFGVQDQAILDVLTGAAEPSGLLPMQMPAHMETVEAQLEDAAHDMECHIDAEGHRYDFGFGLNWGGVIQDSRTEIYKKSR